MTLGKGGDLVSFAISGTTTYGVIISSPDGTHNLVGYDFGAPNKGHLNWAKEFNTTAVTVLQAGQD